MNIEEKIKIDGIVNGIGSPWGEGATYEYCEDASSHLDNTGREKLRKDLDTFGQQEREKAVREFAVWVAREKYDLEIFHDLEQFLKESEGQDE